MNKVLLIDKPAGWTSFDVVAKIRGAARAATGNKKIKVGHAGTLDPFATGLLIVLLGNETKNQDSFMKQDKEYVATLKLGFTSTTGDPEGLVEELLITNFKLPDRSQVDNVLKQFLGEIEQIPPIYSAIKVDGQRAYKLARSGETPIMKPRQVVISLLEQTFYYPDELELGIRVKCSSGTYIRTLAEDIGKALGTGAYLTALRRTKIGEFEIKKAQTVEAALSDIAEYVQT